MRTTYIVDGFVSDFNEGGEWLEAGKMQVNVTKDERGCTLSIGNQEKGIQYTIPFDYILKELKKEGRGR